MKSISDYKNLIREIPVEGLSANIKKASWERIEYENKTKIENEIFGESESVEISRYDIFKEKNTLKKIVMILMWGYPTGGRGNHIQDILQDINDLCKRFDKIKNKKYNRDYAQIILSELNGVKGMGLSTLSKLLYFFNISFNNCKCQIFDIKIVNSLNKQPQLNGLPKGEWKQDDEHYFEYIKLLASLSKELQAKPDQIEIFLFHYNLNYKL